MSPKQWSGRGVCVRFRQEAVLNTSATFVLVHGAWLGGWCWKKVMPRLRAAGHEVFAPTLTGLGEHSHLLTPEVDLETHIEDIVAVLEYEDLANVVLVGHSYAGMVIAGVAQEAAPRLAELVYLDAFLPENGKSINDYLPVPHSTVDGWRIKPLDPRTGFGISSELDLAWVAPRLGDLPERTNSQPIELSAAKISALRHTYIQCSHIPHFVEAAERAKRQGFRFFELLSANHCPMITRPDELANILLTLG
jgi:acetyl esterase/lipase